MSYTNYYTSSGMLHVSLPLLMGTRMDVLLFGDDKLQLETLWDDVEKDLRRLEKMLNRFDPESEVSKVNSKAQFSEVQLSDGLWDIMLDCRRYYEWTEGYFDITKSDFGIIVFNEASKSILFDKYGMNLDFGGYAKGYALKQVRNHFEDAGIKRALVSFGSSSVLAIGAQPDGDSWLFGIEDPVHGNMRKTFSLCNDSLSVSGNSPARKQHIINPKTSEYVIGERVVAIVACDPVDAEVLTTAWFASGEETAPAWMDNFLLKLKYLYNDKRN